jgi:hypothetical protein
VSEVLVREPDLGLAVGGPHPRPLQLQTTAADRDLAVLVAMPDRRPFRVVPPVGRKVIPEFELASDAHLFERGGGSMMPLSTVPLRWEVKSWASVSAGVPGLWRCYLLASQLISSDDEGFATIRGGDPMDSRRPPRARRGGRGSCAESPIGLID